MTKSKRLISVLLALFLVLSCCTAGFVAFAQEVNEPVEAVENSLNEEVTENGEVEVDAEVSEAVTDYNALVENKDSLTPEQKEALREASKVIIGFGLDCADKLTSPEAVQAYGEVFASVADAAGEALGELDLENSLNALATAVNSIAEENGIDLANVLDADAPSILLPDLSVYKKTVVTYPDKAPKAQVEKAIPKVDDLIDTILPLLGVEGMENGLSGFVQNDLYTNKMVGKLLKALRNEETYATNYDYAMMMFSTFITVYPDIYWPNQAELEDGMPDLKGFAKKVFELAMVTDEDPEHGMEKFEGDWNKIEFESGDFGFQDGDKEGFKDAVASLFLQFSPVLDLGGMQLDLSTLHISNWDDDGKYTYGTYEYLIPIFELLDLRDVMSSADFTTFVADRTSPENDPMHNRLIESWIRALLDPVCNLIDDLGAAPFSTILDLLPKIAYLLDSAMLETYVPAAVGAAIGQEGLTMETISELLSSVAPDMFPNGLSLTPAGIYDLVAPLLENITVKEEVRDEKTGAVTTPAVTIAIKLDKDNFVKFFSDLAGCGDAVVKDSITKDSIYRLGINSDKADAFVVLFRWLYTEVTTEDNMAAINTLIDTADMDDTVKSIIKKVLSVVASKVSADDVIVLLVNLLAPSVPDIGGILDKLPGMPDIGGILDKIPGLPGITLPGGDDSSSGDSGIKGVFDKVVGFVTGLFGGGGDSGDGNGDGTAQTGDPSIPQTGGKVAMSVFAVAVAAVAAAGAVVLKKKEVNE